MSYKLLLAAVVGACSLFRTTPTVGETVTVTIDAAQKRPAINPFIYGQFIEHLGRCIYGGIWAEMLEDRKFYFPITKEYNPYRSLEDTAFPVVGASPWEIIGDAAGVTMVEQDAFVGDHTPQVAAGGGLRQRDLGVVQGRKYVGYLWAKAADGDASDIEVTLLCGEGSAERVPQRIHVGNEFKKHEFAVTADASTDHAMLEVLVSGDKSVLIGTASLMPADNVRGMRADTLALLKQLDAPLYRWPGGNFVSGYDWRDGVGPRDRRPPRKNPAWTGVEHNDVGIDEFIDFCREVKAEPMIAANTGFGDDYSAAQEVEYTNGATDTIGGSWRAENGHDEPYNVKYWCVGNEMFGDWQLGYMRRNQYSLKHNLFARAMRKADPSLVLVGVGDLGADPDARNGWSRGMLRDSREHMDLISEHFYQGRTPWGGQTPDDMGDYVAMLKNSIREKADGHRKLQTDLGLAPDRLVPIAMDEWNYWHRDYQFGELGCHYDLADALGVAAGLHEYFRQSDMIHMANYAQTVNVIGCIKTTKTEAFLDTTALPLMLYRKHFGTTPLGVSGDHERLDVDVAAALTEEGDALTVGVVNPNKEPVSVKLETNGLNAAAAGRQWVVAGDDPKAISDVGCPGVEVAESEVTVNGDWTVPGYGFAILRLPVE